MTTKSVGIDADIANPKPVRPINWLGNPMKEGESYWGESLAEEPVLIEAPKPREPRVKRVKRSWTATQIEAMRTRMAHARAAAKAKREQSTTIEGT